MTKKRTLVLQHGRLTAGTWKWNKMMVSKMIFLFNWVVFTFHVNLPGCTTWQKAGGEFTHNLLDLFSPTEGWPKTTRIFHSSVVGNPRTKPSFATNASWWGVDPTDILASWKSTETKHNWIEKHCITKMVDLVVRQVHQKNVGNYNLVDSRTTQYKNVAQNFHEGNSHLLLI